MMACAPRISVAVMYHPARQERLARLARACLPLRIVPVADPDPGSFPSPLRTAKRAWAAYGADATHHLVLQDDVLPVDGFSTHLLAAVAARPDDVLALYAHWNSPYNSYAIRQAAAGGAPWARLVPGEWTPAQGLVLPVALAAELGEYLADVPDHVRDDDTLIDRFLRERDRCALAAVPHLLDHDEVASVAGNAGHGVRRATVLLPGADLPPEHWSAPPRFDKGAVMRAAGARDWDFSVTFAFAGCFLGFLRPVNDDCVRHPFGRWSDWCGVLGLGRADVLGPLEAFLGSSAGRDLAGVLEGAGTSPEIAAELWAAAFLLGTDAADGAPAGPLTARLRRAVITSWVDSGLSGTEKARLTPAARSALVEMGVEGLACGLAHGPVPGGGRPVMSRGPLPGDGAATEAETSPDDRTVAGLVRLLAAREAEGLQRTVCHPGLLTVEVVVCPVCEAGAEQAAAHLGKTGFFPLRVVSSARPGESGAADPPRLRMLGCERLPVHALSLVGHVRERLPEVSGEFVTRSAFLLDNGFPLDLPDPPAALRAVNAAERWADALFDGGLSASTAPAVMVVPSATLLRRRPPAAAGGWIGKVGRYGLELESHPLTPHAPAPPPGHAIGDYAALRDDLLRRRLTEITRNHPPGPRVNGRLDPARFVRR
ncbi:hypothetical protein ACFQVD_14620 [Streptosporangium amethystogenes subsp. fukuiense]|uniref:Uncharacterized protein n=2 Tax=Streptosporangium amethystogenes TaxID=2002 RepID=A0ABW2SZP5_9ACTN